MPIFHDPDRLLFTHKESFESEAPTHSVRTAMRKPSEESIRTEFCDGPEPSPPSWIQALEDEAASMAVKERENRTSDRAELIKRIKRGNGPTWVPNQAFQEEYIKHDGKRASSPTQGTERTRELLPFLPPLEIPKPKPTSQSPSQAVLCPPPEIQRPRSALHKGNFTAGSEGPTQDVSKPPRSLFDIPDRLSEGTLGTSPTTLWYSPVIPWQRSIMRETVPSSEQEPYWSEQRPARSRAPSLHSYSSSYVLKAPTTPLVQQSNSNDLDLPAVSPMDLSESPTKGSRRHTLPSHALSSSAVNDPWSSQSTHQPLSDRMDERYPHQKHRPRRSLTSALQVATSPQPPRPLGSRRQSNSSEISVPHRASMVGSYEESILRGSMSTAPSKPLDFTAQIGVLGKEDYKPKCPGHVTVPFPAVFYSYNTGSEDSSIATEPSPYVGQIDLQNLLPPASVERARRKRRQSPDVRHHDESQASIEHSGVQRDRARESVQVRKRKKKTERSTSPDDVPPGGSYRIPQKGQLQIIIKNPNKTAVKLFLVPYDLTGMEAGTKTFIRQRCYCSGASVQSALGSRSDESSQSSSGFQARKRPSLRYLIHLNICCPSRARFYLYQHIRVVFANRVPDDKEQLRNDIQLPDPRFSAYRPPRESLTPKSSMGAQLAADKAFRRRSAGFGSESEAIGARYTHSLSGYANYPYGSATPAPPVPPIPFDLVMPRVRPSADVSDADTSRPTTATDSQSPLSDRKGANRSHTFGSLKSNSSNDGDSYAKVSRADTSNGGLYGRPNTPEPGEGLLARRLRGLDFRTGEAFDED